MSPNGEENMATLPSGYVYSTQNNHGAAVEKIGGVTIGITSASDTSAGNPITYGFTVRDQAVVRGTNKPLVKTSAGAYNATKAYSAGTFAYDQTVSDWTVQRMGTTLNGVASSVLTFAASAPFMTRRNLKQRAFGASSSTAFRAGYFNMVGVANQRTPWSTSPVGQTGAFVSTTNNSTNSDDQGIYVTFLAIPGELVYLEGGVNDPNRDDYKARDGV